MAVTCGKNQKGDISLTIENIDSNDIEIIVESKYEDLFGKHIRELLRSLATEYELSGIRVTAIDMGAWDYTIRARFKACVDMLKSRCES